MSEKRLFLIVAIFFGLANIIASPPFQVPDEFNHVHRVMQIAGGGFFPVKQASAAGGFVSSQVLEIMRHYEQLPKRPENTITPGVIWNDLKNAQGAKTVPEKKIFLDFNNTAIHIPVAYLPQVIAYKAVAFLTGNFLVQYYLVRLLMLALYILVGCFCLAELPIAKKSFLIFLTLPMSLFIHASFSADYFLNLVYLLLAVMLTKNMLDPLAGSRERIWIAALVFCAGFLKAAYAPLMLALLLLWGKGEKRTANRKLFWIGGLLFIVSTVVAFWFTQRNYFKMLDFVDPVAQMSFITHHPGKFLLIWLKSAIVKFPFIPVGLTTQLGWLDVFIPWYIAFLSLAVFFYVTLSDGVRNILTSRARILYLAAALLCMLSVHLFLYLSWNPVGAEIISGMQGRYMFPAVGFVVLALAGLWRGRFYFAAAFALHIAVLVYSEVFMFYRYFRFS